jgi:hypothetical protein
MTLIFAPWTPEQTMALNAWQACGWVHPFTCAPDRSDAAHRAYVASEGGDLGELQATPDGWICPVCHYRQNWAHDFMLAGPPEHPLAALRAGGSQDTGESPEAPQRPPEGRQ